MSSRAELRRARRRRASRRRTVLASVGAFGLTGAAIATSTLLAPAGAAGAWPTPTGDRAVSTTIEVSGTYDGGLKRFHGSGDLGESGRGPLFELRDGAVLRDVVLGSPTADGVRCAGSCTLRNVWWENAGEGAATFEGTSPSAVRTVTGGGAKGASGQVFRFEGAGKLVVSGFQAAGSGELVSSCEDCSPQHERTITVDDLPYE